MKPCHGGAFYLFFFCLLLLFLQKVFLGLKPGLKIKEDTMAGKLVIATGISGCGRKEIFLPGFHDFCENNEKKVKIYNVGDLLPEWAWENAREELPAENILFVNKQAMSLAHGGVLKDILISLKQDLRDYDVVIINLHTCFLWWMGSIYIPVYNETFVRKLIKSGFEPDMFVCFIDNANDILRRLHERAQWKGENLSEKDLWLWQNAEVNNTKSLTLLSDEKIKFFVMPTREPRETLYYLLFEPWRPIVYAQMPLSHIKANKLKKVSWLINELRKSAVVFDPMTIETGVMEREALDKADGDTEVMVVHTQTGYRDTEWFIPQSTLCLAYYVEVVFTVGVIDETATAAGLGKQTWAIFPGNVSPFMPFRIRPRRIFKTPEECLTAFKIYAEELEKEYKEKNSEARSAT